MRATLHAFLAVSHGNTRIVIWQHAIAIKGHDCCIRSGRDEINLESKPNVRTKVVIPTDDIVERTERSVILEHM